jgi:hypothetical protein
VYAGLVKGGSFFAQLKRDEEADRAFIAADRLASAMTRFYQHDQFAWAIHADGKAEGLRATQRQALANLYGVSYLFGGARAPSRAKVWAMLKKEFQPDRELRVPLAPVERWLNAAEKAADRDEVVNWRKSVVDAVTKFDSATYVHRPALAILALVDGPARLPEVRPPGRD